MNELFDQSTIYLAQELTKGIINRRQIGINLVSTLDFNLIDKYIEGIINKYYKKEIVNGIPIDVIDINLYKEIASKNNNINGFQIYIIYFKELIKKYQIKTLNISNYNPIEFADRYSEYLDFILSDSKKLLKFLNLSSTEITKIKEILNKKEISDSIIEFYFNFEFNEIKTKNKFIQISRVFPGLSDKETYLKYIYTEILSLIIGIENGTKKEGEIIHFISKYQYIFSELLLKVEKVS